MCKFSSKSGGVPFQPLGDLTWNDPVVIQINCYVFKTYCLIQGKKDPVGGKQFKKNAE